MTEDKALGALARIAANPEWRRAFIRQLLAFEAAIDAQGVDVRSEVTGPLVDKLFDDDQVVRKTLSTGVAFDFFYRSKIARDFVMSVPEAPDHAWEPQTTRMLLALAGRARQVVVGGAYFGDHAVLIAREIAARGVVHAFEPNDEQRTMLVHNAELNGLSNIIARPEGLFSDSSSSLKLVGYDSFATSELAEAGAEGGFRTVTIDDYLAAAKVETLDLIALDIEGGELAALQGAETFLARPAGEAPNIVFEVHRHYVDWSNGLENTEIARLLAGHGYSVFALRDFNSNYDMAGRPIEIIPLGSIHLDGPPHGFNMVAVKDPSVFDGEAFRIVRNVSPKLLRHKDPKLHHPVGGF
ncbi:MAG: FkbM family methyltransferase [Phenylobacterium sp.]